MNAGEAIDIFLQPGEYFAGDRGFRVRTLLGSCVSITLWHPRLRVGAMSHFLLPARPGGARPDGRYGDDALLLMLNELRAHGVAARDCEAKVFGGGDMFPARLREGPSIGQRNGAAARALLAASGIAVVSDS
ncbi:MAG: chemotaxis protein CheD, partial [Gammaproteobacteria bacterium]